MLQQLRVLAMVFLRNLVELSNSPSLFLHVWRINSAGGILKLKNRVWVFNVQWNFCGDGYRAARQFQDHGQSI